MSGNHLSKDYCLLLSREKTFRMPAKDVVIEGHFDINSHKVTYQVDGVQSGEIETYEYGTLVTIREMIWKKKGISSVAGI